MKPLGSVRSPETPTEPTWTLTQGQWSDMAPSVLWFPSIYKAKHLQDKSFTWINTIHKYSHSCHRSLLYRACPSSKISSSVQRRHMAGNGPRGPCSTPCTSCRFLKQTRASCMWAPLLPWPCQAPKGGGGLAGRGHLCPSCYRHALTVTRTGLQPLLALAEGHALAVLTLAEIQAHGVIGSVSRRRALAAVTCSAGHTVTVSHLDLLHWELGSTLPSTTLPSVHSAPRPCLHQDLHVPGILLLPLRSETKHVYKRMCI